MKIAKTIERIRQGDRRAGRDVGHSLSGDLGTLREFRVLVTGIEPEGEYAEGYRDALLDVVAAYCAEWHGRAARWPKHWRYVYEALRDPMTPTEVAAMLGLSLSTASRVLARMGKAGLLDQCRQVDGRSKTYVRGKGSDGGV